MIALLAAGAATAWRLTQPVPLGVVNNSHPMHLFVGAAWLSLALAGRDVITRVASGPADRRRSPGHRPAVPDHLPVAHGGDHRGPQHPRAGWDRRTAPRPRPGRAHRRRHPRRRPPLRMGRGPGGAPPVARPRAPARRPPQPAGHRPGHRRRRQRRGARRPPRPPRPDVRGRGGGHPSTATAARAVPAAAGADLRRRRAGAGRAPRSRSPSRPAPGLAARLDGMLTAWLEQSGAGGAMVGIDGPAVRWKGAGGSRPDTGAPLATADRIELASLTKLFTATLVHRYAEAGLIDIDAPLPPLRSLPDFPYDLGITVAQLLDHSSGLINYLDTDLYAFDQEPDRQPGGRGHRRHRPPAGRRSGGRVPVLEHQLPDPRAAAGGRDRPAVRRPAAARTCSSP